MFNTNLRQIRRFRDYTQAEIAEKINITKSGYASWEQGIAEPSIDALKKLCSILNVSSDELLEIKSINLNELYQSNIQKDLNLTESQSELVNSIRDLTDKEIARVLGYVEAMKRDANLRRLINQG